eukprot:CAMPEP_0117538956 /NCGR_PEP_ID=MMETSP0784-20121206/42742_1 /TAXON_ID=39447 /ORGANISM="" /LENGTH=280 /DNA_ID=CAMNT_0005335579 /DNA_START=135 /DNA_END=977 /DNA_ORIENTATION=+
MDTATALEEIRAEEKRKYAALEKKRTAEMQFSALDQMSQVPKASQAPSTFQEPQRDSAAKERPANACRDPEQPFGQDMHQRSRLENARLPATQAPKAVDGQVDGFPLMEGAGIPMDMCRPALADPCKQLFSVAGVHLPTDESFHTFFREWFQQAHFPGFSQDMKRELQHRARSKGILSSLASQVRGWVMDNTNANLQVDVWYCYFAKHAPPRFSNYCVCRTASVNLGSEARPCWVTFFGVPAAHDTWVAPPWGVGAIDYGSLLDELDSRGGEAALLTAAA